MDEYPLQSWWMIEYVPDLNTVSPHTEDVHVHAKRRIDPVAGWDFNRVAESTDVWRGSMMAIFDREGGVTGNGSLYVDERSSVDRSVGFWYPDSDLTLDGKHYVNSAGRRLAYTGAAPAIPKIPAGALVRVSLARWWRPEGSDIEDRCYAQLSGWFRSPNGSLVEGDPHGGSSGDAASLFGLSDLHPRDQVGEAERLSRESEAAEAVLRAKQETETERERRERQAAKDAREAKKRRETERARAMKALKEKAAASLAQETAIGDRLRQQFERFAPPPDNLAMAAKNRIYWVSLGPGYLVIRGVRVPAEMAIADGVRWVRSGRPDDIEAFKLVRRSARFVFLRLLQALDL